MEKIAVSLIVAAAFWLSMVQRYLPFASVISPKKKKILFGIHWLYSAINFCLCLWITTNFGTQAAFSYLRTGGIACSCIMVLAEIILIPRRNREHIFIFGVVILCASLLQTIPTYICSLLPPKSPDERFYLWLTIYFGLLLVLFLPVRTMLRVSVEPFLYQESSGYWNTICFIPAAYFCAMILFVGGAEDVDPGSQMVSSMMSGTLIVLLCISVSQDHKRLQEQAAVKKQLDAQKIHYAELQVRVEDARKIRHDYKHHLAAIRHFINTDDKQGLQNYCDEVQDNSLESIPIPYTGNSAADGVLYHFMQMARRNDIHLDYKGTIQSSGISDSDLCVLMGNALDNAATGCMTLPEGRQITLIFQSEPYLLSLMIRNTFDGNVNTAGDTPMSRKRNNRPGVGISSMRDICRKYGGNLELSWDEKTFTTMILLPRKQPPAESK